MSIQTRTYKDLSYNFFSNPMNGDVGKTTGSSSIKSAILSILKTDFNERLFGPDIGSNIRALLFEQMNPITEQRLKTEVINALIRHEPRAQVLDVAVDAQEEQNRYKIRITFSIASEIQPQVLETFFEKA